MPFWVFFGIFSPGPGPGLGTLGIGAFGSNGNNTPISHYDTSHRLRYEIYEMFVYKHTEATEYVKK